MQQLKIKTDLTKEAFDAIREAILSGKLPPGTPVGQEEMADRLGVSRQPVSRALVLLKREGLIVDRGRKGQMVAPIDADRLVALFQVRGSLDRLAARLVAANRDAATIAADRLGALIVTGRDAAARQDFAALAMPMSSFIARFMNWRAIPRSPRRRTSPGRIWCAPCTRFCRMSHATP